MVEIRQQMADMVGTTSSPSLNSSCLAEPPHVRERLIQEIKFFISHLRSRSDGIVTSASRTDKSHLVQYVIGADAAEIRRVTNSRQNSRGGSRPDSAIDFRDSRSSPLNPTRRGGSRGGSRPDTASSGGGGDSAAEIRGRYRDLLLVVQCIE